MYERKPAPAIAAGWEVSSVTGTPGSGPKPSAEPVERAVVVGQCLKPTVDHGPVFKLNRSVRLRWSIAPACVCSRWNRSKAHCTDFRNHSCVYLGATRRIRVDTPSAVTVDLGCCVHVAGGRFRGIARTSLGVGRVQTEWRESFIPLAQLRHGRKPVPDSIFRGRIVEISLALTRFDSRTIRHNGTLTI